MTPRNVKQAFEMDFCVTKIYAKYSGRIRVTFRRRNHIADEKDFFEFWINENYFARTYSEVYNRF